MSRASRARAARLIQSRSRLIRKSAKLFRVGEFVYLFSCDTGEDLYGVLQGAFEIVERKHRSDTGVTFRLRRFVFDDMEHETHGVHSYVVEFAHSEQLHRLAGEPVSFVIRELEEVC